LELKFSYVLKGIYTYSSFPLVVMSLLLCVAAFLGGVHHRAPYSHLCRQHTLHIRTGYEKKRKKKKKEKKRT
jgi:hypothetical protein